jgi:hypothetical protein
MTGLPLDFFGVQFCLPKEEEAEELLARESRRQNQTISTKNANGGGSTFLALADENAIQLTNDVGHKGTNRVAGTLPLRSESSPSTLHAAKTESKENCRVSPLKINTRKKRAFKGGLELNSLAQPQGDLQARHEAFSASIQRDIDLQLMSFNESSSSSDSDDWKPEIHPDSYIGKVKAERDLRRRHFRQTSATLFEQAKTIQCQPFGSNTMPVGDSANLEPPPRPLQPQRNYPPYCPDIMSSSLTVLPERGHDTVVKSPDTDQTVEFKNEISLFNEAQTTCIANNLDINKNVLEQTAQFATLAETTFGVSPLGHEKDLALFNQEPTTDLAINFETDECVSELESEETTVPFNQEQASHLATNSETKDDVSELELEDGPASFRQEQTAQPPSNPKTNDAARETTLDAQGPVSGFETEVAVAAFELGLTSTIITPKELSDRTVTVTEQPIMAPSSPIQANEMPSQRLPLRQPLSPDHLFGIHPRVSASGGQSKATFERYSSHEVYVPHWFPFFVSMNIMTFSGGIVDGCYIQLLNRLVKLEDEATSKSIAEAKGVKLWDKEWHEPSKNWPWKHQQVHGG